VVGESVLAGGAFDRSPTDFLNNADALAHFCEKLY
jgi:hypothetical protein